MTVDELIAALQKLSAEGKGQWVVEPIACQWNDDKRTLIVDDDYIRKETVSLLYPGYE